MMPCSIPRLQKSGGRARFWLGVDDVAGALVGAFNDRRIVQLMFGQCMEYVYGVMDEGRGVLRGMV